MSTPLSLDRLSDVLLQHRVRAHLFHNGPLCGVSLFDAQPQRAFLHVMRRGQMVAEHPAGSGAPRRLQIDEPSLLFYPRSLEHRFINPPEEGADFTCATLEFEGGDLHPLVQALPPLIHLPLKAVDGLDQSLQLLFAETQSLRCGQRLLADRLFEVVLIQLLRWLLDHPAQVAIESGLIAGLSDARLAKALVALHERPGEAWSLARMAEAASMSRSAFAERFHRVMACTPAHYLLQYRLRLAQKRLLAGEPLKSIADELGYTNPTALSRVFKQQVGHSPREWLQQQSPPSAPSWA